ncbi:MAG: hypothetical protein Q9161_004821 [Pseudevernia consocians]
MAHRGPLREMFGMLCIALFVPKIEKTIMPTSNRAIIIDHADNDDVPTINTLPITTPPTTTPPTSGFLLYLLAFLAPALSVIGDELLNMAFIYMLNNGLLPFVTVIKRFFFRIFPSESQEASNQTRQPNLPAEEDNDDHMRFDTVESQPASEDIPNNTQALIDLRAESADKDAKIVTLTRDAKQNDRQNGRLMSNLRDALNPRGLYTSTTDIVLMATHLTNDFKRVSRKIRRQKKQLKIAQDLPENRQLADKDAQISTLSAENSTLKNRVMGLEVGQLGSVQAVKDVKEAARERERTLKKRVSDAKKTAGEAISPREYNSLRDQFELVAVELRQLKAERQTTLDEHTPLTTELEAERAGMQELTTATENLQLANGTIADLEEGARAKDAEVQTAEQRARDAESQVAANVTRVTELEKSLREAQHHDTQNATRVTELEQSLREAQTQNTQNASRVTQFEQNLQEAQHHDTQKAARVTQLEQSLREAQNHDTQNASRVTQLEKNLQEAQDHETQKAARVTQLEQNLKEVRDQAEEQTTEINGLRSKLEEAVNRNLSNEDQQALRREGYALGVDACEQQGRRLIDEAVQKERNEAATRLTAVETKNNADLTEARNWADDANDAFRAQEQRANEAEENATKERDRAEAAEEEVRKYRNGKASQDDRIKGLHQDLATAKREVPTKLTLARIQARENERIRAWALVEESANRSYDGKTRKVLLQLTQAKLKIDAFELMLRNPNIRSNQTRYLNILGNADIKNDDYEELDISKCKVLVTQCMATNSKLSALRHKINTRKNLDKDPLFEELYSARGDEGARWNDPDIKSQPESDEDEDDNGGSGRAPDASSRPIRPLPTGPRNMQSQQTEREDTPLPTDPYINNPLKRKVNVENPELDGSGKRDFALEMGMRPMAGPSHQPPQFPQQGSSSSEADVGLSETKPESQDELPSSERIGEATAPQQQSNDQAYVPKPTKIPGPKHTADLTSSGRQERLYDDGNSTLTEGSTPPATDGPNVVSFNAPKDIASAAINPTPAPTNHRRIFTGLSLLGAAMADKDSRIPGLPPLEQDEVLEFESSALTEDQESDPELDDRFLSHTASGDEDDDDETAWEDALYRDERDDYLHVDLRAYYSTTGEDGQPSTVRALDMTEQNYEEQAAQAEAAMQGIQQAPSRSDGQPENEELEDTFHIDLD